MIIKTLTLRNFRNYRNTTFEFKPHINVLLGDNGIGKTNVVEAIYYLSLARSFRGVEDDELIMDGNEYGYINSEIEIGGLKRKIDVILSKTGRQITLNGKPITKLSDLSKSVNVILFEPKDVMLFRGSPKERRDFLNISLSKYSESYLNAISRYNRVLKERNNILKANEIDKVLLDTNTEMLIQLALPIVNYRLSYIKDINDILLKITRALTGVKRDIKIIYHPFVGYNDEFRENAQKAYEKALDTDLKQKATTIGVHREDFHIELDGKDIAKYGSQGENRLVALSLKLAPYFLITDKNKKPIVVLDDVMSELDEIHQNNLITFLKKMDQVFITATKLVIVGATHYEIKEKLN